MKSKLIIFLCLFLSVLNAQTFKSYFGKEYSKWYILYDGKFCPNTFNYLTCNNRTTIIDGKIYKLLFEIYESLNDTLNSVPANTLSYQYLREDSVSGRLYYRYMINSDYGTSYSPEILVSDMSLHVGDSILLKVTDANLSLWDNLKLSTYDNKYYAMVDSVFFKDGLKYVRTSALFNSDYNNMFEKPKTALTFIEGVGSNLSPTLDYSRFAYMSDISKLMCNVQDNNTTHFNTSGLCKLSELICDVGVHEIEDNHKFSLTLSDGNINIKFTSLFSGKVRLLQSTGVVVYETPVVNLTDHKINAQNLQSGVYILQTISFSGMITTRKLILK